MRAGHPNASQPSPSGEELPRFWPARHSTCVECSCPGRVETPMRSRGARQPLYEADLVRGAPDLSVSVEGQDAGSCDEPRKRCLACEQTLPKKPSMFGCGPSLGRVPRPLARGGLSKRRAHVAGLAAVAVTVVRRCVTGGGANRCRFALTRISAPVGARGAAPGAVFPGPHFSWRRGVDTDAATVCLGTPRRWCPDLSDTRLDPKVLASAPASGVAVARPVSGLTTTRGRDAVQPGLHRCPASPSGVCAHLFVTAEAITRSWWDKAPVGASFRRL